LRRSPTSTLLPYTTLFRSAVNNPEDPAAGMRRIPFGRELYIERDDFAEHPPPKFYRLSPGREVRLRYGYFVTCREVNKDAAGERSEEHTSELQSPGNLVCR